LPATDGALSVKGLPPGEYFLAALADLETGEWNDPALLDQLVRRRPRSRCGMARRRRRSSGLV